MKKSKQKVNPKELPPKWIPTTSNIRTEGVKPANPPKKLPNKAI